jgi:hypothetical protein
VNNLDKDSNMEKFFVKIRISSEESSYEYGVTIDCQDDTKIQQTLNCHYVNKKIEILKVFRAAFYSDCLTYWDDNVKCVRSKNYNYNFDKNSGFFMRWGKTIKDDPEVAPFPEILDIEVSEICGGIPNLRGVETPCTFCYKKNTAFKGSNMSFETFKKIIDKMPFLTQVAFGADAKGTSNPDLFKMMEYSRSIGIIPNITLANVSDEIADNVSSLCGAIAISRYENKDICYNSVKKLVDRGMKQVNIHQLVSQNTKDQIWETLEDFKNDERLNGLNAIVMLSLKKVGRGVNYESLPEEEFKKIVDYALDNKIGLGFDSCSQGKFEKSVRGRDNYEQLVQLSDPCESTAFSVYINVHGEMFACSFNENSDSFPTGTNVVECEDFIKDVWNNPLTEAWRSNMLKKRCEGCSCPVYEI